MPIKSLVKQIFGSSHFRPVVIPFSAKVFFGACKGHKMETLARNELRLFYDSPFED